MCKAIQCRQRNGRLILCVASLLICALVTFSCTHTHPPKWFNDTPDDKKYYYGVGSSSESIDEAEEKAREDLVKNIKIKIKHEYTLIEKHSQTETYGPNQKPIEKKDQALSQSDSRTTTVAEGVIAGSKIYKRHKGHEGHPDHYALAKLSHKNLCKQVKKDLSSIEKMVADGDKKLEEKDIVAALELYNEALLSSESITIIPDCNIKEEISYNKIKQKIDIPIDIEPISGDKQIGEYGNALAEPLVVKVQYQGSPLEDFPLQATYTRGTGQLENRARGKGYTVRTRTDETGKAAFWVKAIKSISQNNFIQVAADTASFQAPVKAINFRYASSFPNGDLTGAPIVYLNGDTEEQEFAVGESVDFEIYVEEKSTVSVSLFKIFPDGNGDLELMYTTILDDSRKGYGDDCYYIDSEKQGWQLHVRCGKVTEERGFGLETLLVVKTGIDNLEEKPGTTWGVERLIKKLDESFGRNVWRAGWVSYMIKKD